MFMCSKVKFLCWSCPSQCLDRAWMFHMMYSLGNAIMQVCYYAFNKMFFILPICVTQGGFLM